MSGQADIRYPAGLRTVVTRHTASTTVTAISLPSGALFVQLRPQTNGLLVIASNNTTSAPSVVSTGGTALTNGILALTASVASDWYPVAAHKFLICRGNGGKSTINVVSALGNSPVSE